ncbi:MAG: response regulator [Lachnospiraceae bacterium]|nr:response regulator [Lachnospiraceae bacterium]
MLGVRFRKIDDVVINVTRHIAVQFVDYIRESFPSIGLFQLEKESLLTYEQFVNSFQDETPECSLLFNTGEGYMGFCILAAGAADDDLGLKLTPKNASDEIKKYLSKENTPKKSQVLVVDDSDTVLHAMKMLLGSDYEVVLANSAGSAIKSIARNKPELILLDYEMPICDGRQTLQMIRSEEEMADIPVIFLTGRGDKESVKNVMSLKPAGYLLKSMKPEEIKKAIDSYFKKRGDA